MNVASFRAADLKLVRAAAGNVWFGDTLDQPGYGEFLERAGPAWTAFDDVGVIGCGGIMYEHQTLGTAWTLLTPRSGSFMTPLHRYARRALTQCPLVRVQAHVDPGFAPAVRWIEMLGFVREGLLRKFTPQGRDMLLFARVR